MAKPVTSALQATQRAETNRHEEQI